jgi:hypothetical protein
MSEITRAQVRLLMARTSEASRRSQELRRALEDLRKKIEEAYAVEERAAGNRTAAR